ncbi:MAG: hypothetical protein ACI9JM_002312 [Halioglobus sp.]|jgi:hypothetical protein
MYRLFVHCLNSALLICLLSGVAIVPVAHAKSAAVKEQRSLTASEAAAKAKAQHGGKVLKVRTQGNGYSVRLLKNSGRIITVKIKG